MRPFTICILCYGDRLDLVQRCLGAVEAALFSGGGHARVEEVRIGMNECSLPVQERIQEATTTIAMGGVGVHRYWPERNAGKYPLMRRIFFGDSAAEPSAAPPLTTPLIVWFDDDSYLDAVSPEWWRHLEQLADLATMVGQYSWQMPFRGNQKAWLRAQPWFNPRKALRRTMQFCQGGWWVLQSRFVREHNWPWPELHHNGGDSTLGECLRQLGEPITEFDTGVHSNSGADGGQSTQRRRGIDQKPIGYYYQPDQPTDLSHQQFKLRYHHAN